MPDEGVVEVLENQIWMGLTLWREAFVVPFIAGTVPAWSDACFNPVQLDTQPRSDGDHSWQILRSPATDPDGWVYGTAFDHLKDDRPGGRASKRANDRVRSRLWRRVESVQQQQQHNAAQRSYQSQQQQQGPAQPVSTPAAAADVSTSKQQPSAPAADAMSAAAAAVSAAAEQTAAAGKAAFQGASQAAATVQAVTRSVKKASIMGMWNAFFKLIRDAAERHNTVMITPDISGWFFAISSHAEDMKKQQLSQLQSLVWFTPEQQLQAGMVPGGLGLNAAGVVLPDSSAWVVQKRSTTSAAAAAAGAGSSADWSNTAAAAGGAAGDGATPSQGTGKGHKQGQKRSDRQQQQQQQQQQPYELPGRPFRGMTMHLGAKGSSSSSRSSKPSAQHDRAAAAAGAGVQLHVGGADLIDDLLAGARYAHASYGYAAAGGHLSTVTNAIKMLATMPIFDPITGVSVQANTQALMSLAGVSSPEDVLLTCWHNDTFRPCHYVAVDRSRRNIILAVRGSLEVGDLETDVTAAPLAWEFQGVSGWVHEGLLAAAAYVVANTVDALAEAANRHPGWPLVVAGHSLGGGVAALVTLLLQQPGAAPRGISSIRCITLGPAAVLSEELCAKCAEYITSIILGTDSIPRLSTYSVESLLLDLVNASITRKVTNQLAATTSSVAASTGAALNTITQGLTQGLKTLANSASGSVNNMAGVITNSLANNKFTGSFSSLASLAGSFQPVVPAVQQRIGPGSTVQSFQIRPGGSAVQISGPGGTVQGCGSGGSSRRSLELARLLQGPAAAAAGVQSPRGGLQELHDLLRDERSQESSRLGKQQQQRQHEQQQQHKGMIAVEDAATAAAGDPKPAPAAAAAAQAPGAPAAAATAHPSSSSGSPLTRPQPSLPGGPKLVQGSGSPGQPTLIFPRVDYARILDGIHQACAEINCAEIKQMSSSTSGPSSSSRQQQQQQQQVSEVVVTYEWGSAAAAAGDHAGSSSRSRVPKSPSESDLQKWASDGLQPLGEPSWVRISQTSSQDGAAAAAASSSGGGSDQSRGASATGSSSDGSSGGGDAQENTVKALTSDLRHTPRLYPPGRIFWALTDDIVGPAAQQLMTAVAAHLASLRLDTPAAAAASSTEPGSSSGTKLVPARSAPAAMHVGSSSEMQAPQQVQMDMPASIESKPQQQQQQQHKRTKREVARDTATAHAVAAASARHILQDVHSTDAKRSAAAALHAAQHEHPPLQMSDSESTEDMESQLQQQQQDTAVDWAAGDAAAAAAMDAESAVQQQQQQHKQNRKQQQQLQQQRQPSPSGVQMTSMFARSASKPLEVDGSAPGLSKHGSNPDLDLDIRSQDLPPDLHDLINILGQPTDAASAIAIAHKKQLLLDHYRKQRRKDAEQQHKQQQQQQQLRLERKTSSCRSSTSSLLKYEDMVPPVDQEYVGLGSGCQQQQQQLLHRQQSPELELVSQSSRGSSMRSDEGLGDPTWQQQQQHLDWPHSADQGSFGSDSGVPARQLGSNLLQGHYRSQSWSVGGTGATSATAAAAGARGSRSSSSSSSRGSSGGDQGMWGLTRTLSGFTRQQQQQDQQQQLQLSMFRESEEYVVWAAEQAALHKQQQDELQQQQQQKKKPKVVEHSEAPASFQEMAVGSLIELAQLPERIAESLSALTMGGLSGSEPGAAGSGHPCDDSGIAALCPPALTPATAAGIDGSPKAPVNRMPVIVMPERDVFGRLLLLKTSFQDHLPSNYIDMLHKLKAAAAQPQQPWRS